jgi:hypothetical protein
MDAFAPGDSKPFDRVMDADCIVTDEEGNVSNKQQFLKDLRPLPKGLSGQIAVKELTVQEFPGFAVVRFLADESEQVFGQQLHTKYRFTDTYRRVGSDWKMVASHTSVITQDPPAQNVSKEVWPGLVGDYELLPDGWIVRITLRDGNLYSSTDRDRSGRFGKPRRLIPLTPDAFTAEGSLGEWLFVIDRDGKSSRIVDFRKFEPLVWTRVAGK